MPVPVECGSREEHPCVLVVDDDPNIRRMIIAALKRTGLYSFAEASNGREALESMRSEPPAVVVLDLMMPVVSGWEVLQERSRETTLTRIPVIVISASRDAQVVNAIDKGICAFLPKPFDIGSLTALVKSCVCRESEVQNQG